MNTRDLDLFIIHINNLKFIKDKDVNWRDRDKLNVLAYDKYISYRFYESEKIWYVNDKGKELIEKGGYVRLAECQCYQTKAKRIAYITIFLFFVMLVVGIANKLWYFVVLAFLLLSVCIAYGKRQDKKYKW